jgi:hypothetical protein
MGEPAAAEAAASERDVLLATKLNVPGLRPDLVPRPRLAERLDEGLGEGLVLVCAPAGYGKTVLLAGGSGAAGIQWPGRRWTSATTTRPGSGRMQWPRSTGCGRGSASRVGPLFGAPAPASFAPPVAALVNEVAAQPDAGEVMLLVLDDYHLISSQPVHASLGYLLEHRPRGLHLLLSSRSDPLRPTRLGCLLSGVSWLTSGVRRSRARQLR